MYHIYRQKMVFAFSPFFFLLFTTAHKDGLRDTFQAFGMLGSAKKRPEKKGKCES